MRIALDSNILVYAEGVNGVARKKDALAVTRKLPEASTFVPVQALGELFRVLVKKDGRSPAQADTTRNGFVSSHKLEPGRKLCSRLCRAICLRSA